GADSDVRLVDQPFRQREPVVSHQMDRAAEGKILRAKNVSASHAAAVGDQELLPAGLRIFREDEFRAAAGPQPGVELAYGGDEAFGKWLDSDRHQARVM